MKKQIVSLALCLMALFLTACPAETPNVPADDPGTEMPAAHTHAYTQEVVDAAYCKAEADCTSPALYYYSCTCGACGTETFSEGEALPHRFTRQQVQAKYLAKAATQDTAAQYYYSCEDCGACGTTCFSHGSSLSGFTAVEKTVYGQGYGFLHTGMDDTRNFCGGAAVGEAFSVIATNGQWYKVRYSGQGYAYVMCKYLTEDRGAVTFRSYSEPVGATLRDGVATASLYQGLGGDAAFSVHGESAGTFDVIAVNQTGTWYKVRYCGTDTKGEEHDGTKIYYCPASALYSSGL